jgi:hypothetical protein
MLKRNVYFFIENKSYDISSGKFEIKRSFIFPFIKRFLFKFENEIVCSWLYWWADIHEWPDDEILDIFLYVAKYVKENGFLESFHKRFTLIQNGMSSMEAAEAMEAEKIA